MRLVLDMNLPPNWQVALRAAGFEADHWSRLGQPDATDQQILAFVRDQGAILVTHDLDFGTILAASGDRAPSVVIVRSDVVRFDDIGGSVISTLRQFRDALEAGALISLHPKRTRVRMLPLR